jgi:outer membrane lipoprotein-sorting protein
MSHSDQEQELDQYIDALNAERRPEQPSSPEVAALAYTVRSVKALKQPAGPSPGFEARLLQRPELQGRGRPRTRWLLTASVAAAAVLLVAVAPSLMHQDVALAMAKAIDRVERYHGTLEMRLANAAGAEQVVRTQEIWVDDARYAVILPDGTLTVNNGDKKWQVRPGDQVVAVLPVAPDPQRIGLDLKEVGDAARRYPHRVVGQENVAGRPADVLEISPPGGAAYRLWVDEGTDLPVRMVTAMQNALQTTYTYTRLEINQPIDASRFVMTVPTGYRVVEKDPGQQVSTPDEAAARLGFQPVMPAVPSRMIAYQDRLVLEYGQSTVVEANAAGAFKPATAGALGMAAGGPLEVVSDHLRWRQGGLEITVSGPDAESLARSIAPDLKLPAAAAGFPQAPQVPVAADMEVERNNQAQVDAGHSPYLLDPTMVANSLLGSKGIQLDMDTLKVTFATATHAVVDVPTGPIRRVYVQRLVRQDETGVWTVVGYDPR